MFTHVETKHMSTAAKRTNRREQLLSEAGRLFARGGYEGTSLRAIAGACGITEAAIYRHFESKGDLYEAVIRWKADQHDVEGFIAEEMGEGNVEEVLTGVALHILQYVDSDPEFLDLMFSNSVESGPAAAVLFKRTRMPYIDFLAADLERRIESGEVRPVDPSITARCFVGMVMDCALSVGTWNKVMKFDFKAGDVVANNVPIFARGLRCDTRAEEKAAG